MTSKTQRVWDALKEIYGKEMIACTLVVLFKNKNSVELTTTAFPDANKLIRDRHRTRVARLRSENLLQPARGGSQPEQSEKGEVSDG